MQWQPISECDLDCFENLDVVSFGRTLEYLKKQGATHFMIYEFPEGEL